MKLIRFLPIAQIGLAFAVASCSGGGSSSNQDSTPDSATASAIQRDVSSLVLDESNDVNADGIRDDVNQMIEREYMFNVELANGVARTVNAYAIAVERETLHSAMNSMFTAVECTYLFGSSESDRSDASEIVRKISEVTFNSRDRAKAYFLAGVAAGEYTVALNNPTRDECFE